MIRNFHETTKFHQQMGMADHTDISWQLEKGLDDAEASPSQNKEVLREQAISRAVDQVAKQQQEQQDLPHKPAGGHKDDLEPFGGGFGIGDYLA